MKRIKQTLAITLILLMMTTTVFAGTDNVKGSIKDSSEAKVIKTEVVQLNNENVVLTTFDNNGVTTITATGRDGKQLSPDTYVAISNYLRGEESSDKVTALSAENPQSTTQTGYSSTNGYCSVTMDCEMGAWTVSPHKLYINDGYTEGCYMGSGIAASMRLSQKYAFSGVGVSLSYPPSFSKSGNTLTWVGTPSYNCNYEKAYRDTDVSGTCLVSTFSLTCTDYSDIKIGTTTHKANTSWKRSIFDFTF